MTQPDPWPITATLYKEDSHVVGARLPSEAVQEHLTEHPEGNLLQEAHHKLEMNHIGSYEIDVTFYETGEFSY